MVRIIIAGVVGGIAMFVWSFISHVILPIGEVGVTTVWNETAVVAAMKNDIKDPGFYFFPGMDKADQADPAKMAAWTEKYKAGPRGILIYHPTGEEPMGARTMLTELLSNILAAIAGAIAISWLICNFYGRVATAGLIGFAGWMSIDVSLWNWYGFPASYMLAQGVDQVVGWLIAGAVMALILKSRGE